MSTVSKMAVKGVPLNPVAQAQTETAEDKHPPGGTEAGTAATPKKIFVCSPYRPTAENLRCQKSQLEANIDRAKTACRILSTLGFLPLAPHLYFTQFLKDEEKKERETGMKLGLHWLEEADELWVFGDTVSEGMTAEIKKAHELNKPVRNLPEPGRVIELLLKSISEQYQSPLDDKTEDQKSKGQQDAAESEDNHE